MLDVNVVSSDNSLKPIDRNKLRRTSKSKKVISTVYFDDRKDIDFTLKWDGKLSLISEYHEHLSIDSRESLTIKNNVIKSLDKSRNAGCVVPL